MDSASETNDTLLTVACRFVPNDQWLTTHLDQSWSIKQVKHWILSKCNLVDTPSLPRSRAVSPITFASTAKSRCPGFESNGNESDEEERNVSSSGIEDGYRNTKRNRNLTENSVHHPRRSESSIQDSTIGTAADPLLARYTILTFSNSHILDDYYLLSWYHLHPYELLEIHPACSIVQLPREVIVQYVQPYFEAGIRTPQKVLRDDPQPPRDRFVDRSKSGKLAKGRLVSSDPLGSDIFRDKKKERKKMVLEWSRRWVVIHQGVLHLCADRFDQTPLCRIPLASVIALRGAEHVPKASSFMSGKRIVCAKVPTTLLRQSGGMPNKRRRDKTSTKMPSNSSPSRSYHLPASPSLHSPPAASSSRSTAASSELFTSSAPPALPPLKHSAPSPEHVVITPASNGSLNSRHNLCVDNSSNDGLKMEFGGGLVERWDKDMGTGAEEVEEWNTTANVSASSSVSNHDGDDDDREIVGMKWRDKGKWKAQDVEEVKEAEAEEEQNYEWVVMQFGDDNSFTAILRILHRDCPHHITSSFVPQSLAIISNTANSSTIPTSTFTPDYTTVISPSTNSVLSLSDSPPLYPMSLDAVPYPEWRIEVATCAQKAGLGHVSPGLAWVRWGEDQDKLKSKFTSVTNSDRLAEGGRPRGDTLKSTTSDGTVVGYESIRAKGEESDQDSENISLSDCEWEGWMRDLSRRGQAQVARHIDDESHWHPTPSQPLPTQSSVDTLHHHAPTPTLSSPAASSRASSPSTAADLSSANQSVFRSPPSVEDGSTTPVVPTSSHLPIASAASAEPNRLDARRRSSTLTASHVNLFRKKDKEKRKEMSSPHNEDGKSDLPANTKPLVKKKSILSKPYLSLTFSNHSASGHEDAQLATTTTTAHNSPQTSVLRHIRSMSSIKGIRSTPTENVEPLLSGAASENPNMPANPVGGRRAGLSKGFRRKLSDYL